MGDPSHLLKLSRAREHLQSLKIESAAWIETEPYEIIDEPDPEPPPQPLRYDCHARRFRVTRANDIPGRFGILIGDCLFNLRSALDHIAFALARNFTPNMSADSIKASEFPIFKTAPENPKKWLKCVECLSPSAQAAIESLQPYQRGQGAAFHPLWQIHELNIVDKHRQTTACVAVSMRNGTPCVTATWREGQNFNYWPYQLPIGGVLKVDAIIFRWAAMPIDPDRDIHLEPCVSAEIVFDESGSAGGEPVVPLLQSLCDFVGDVVMAQLAKFL